MAYEPVGGDLRNSMPSPTVQGLQGKKIATTTPTDGQVLQYVAAQGKWVPTTPAAAALGLLTPAKVTLTDAATTVWATGGAPINTAKWTAAAARTLSITGAIAGAKGSLYYTQAGAFVPTLPSGSKVFGAVSPGVPVLSASGTDRLDWYYDGTNYWWTVALAAS